MGNCRTLPWVLRLQLDKDGEGPFLCEGLLQQMDKVMEAPIFLWKSLNKSTESEGSGYTSLWCNSCFSLFRFLGSLFFQLVTSAQNCYLLRLTNVIGKMTSINPAFFTRERSFSKLMPGILSYLVGTWKTQSGLLWGWGHRILSWRLLEFINNKLLS